MIKEAISKLSSGKNLNFDEANDVFEEIFAAQATPSQIAAFLVALKMKGEVEDEITAAAMVVREKARKLDVRGDFLGLKDKNLAIMDTCGTGGSGLNKFNISSAVSFVVSSAGVCVAKHGNRAMSSTSGSADVFKALGIKVDAPTDLMEKAIKSIGIGFLYAPLYHPALGAVAQIRKDLGIRTIFNILGPLCNPAKASHQLLGVYSKDLVLPLARVLKKLGITKAFVVNSKDLGDEISLSGGTKVSFISKNKITNFSLSPADFGLKKIKQKDIMAKDVKMSAKIIKDVLKGKKGAPQDIVLANSSACFYILGKVKNLKDGVSLARELIDNGLAYSKLIELKEFLDKNA